MKLDGISVKFYTKVDIIHLTKVMIFLCLIGYCINLNFNHKLLISLLFSIRENINIVY